ncbi:unnamed protein product [Menidia menidia]|uniref:(Atlantic silverside) hypothetical protein n=1 Tax=Menidia menidia TaxID=238744 RepID=A0A8S4AFG6_9TELE|nr:unnamed protein product [Menidia menidia]
MPVMSVPAQQKASAKRTGKRITFFSDQTVAMKETSQHPEGAYYVPSGTASDPGQSEAASTVTSNPEGPHMYLSSVIFSPDKGDQSRGHYQQTVPMKWPHQEPSQQQPSLSQQQRAATWTSMPNWGQNFTNYIGGLNVTDSRTQNAFAKSMHETSGLQPHQQAPNRAADKPAAEAYRDAAKPRGLEWEQPQPQQQQQHQASFQETLKPGALNAQQQGAPHPGGSSPVVVHSLESSAPAPPKIQEPLIQDITPEPRQPSDPLPAPPQAEPPPQTQLQSQTQLRRSRRLSKEGGAPSDNPFLPASADQVVPGPPRPENGARDVQAAPTGVIQSTRRKRRVSQEVNLEMLAQEASERKSPTRDKEPHRPWSPAEPDGMNAKRPRDDSLLPLVIPVSVPVRRQEPSSPDRHPAALASSWPPRASNPQDLGRADHKPSVIVTRRRSLRNSLSESSEQNDCAEGEKDDDGKKSKRRPRPEPLFIPPPKPALFIAPPIYSSITPYQSHLRSPVRLVDNPITMPPYTPPPILSPVREGSGLYFSTFLSSSAASGPGLQPSATPKSASRSLLRSNSCDITPPVLSAMSEATPVSIEPRINIGSRYQAEVPELRQRAAVELDQHRAQLVWAPLNELEEKPDFQGKVEDLMHLACSSVLCGGGTNQELALHCLYECKGDIMAALSQLLLRSPIFPKSHHLSNYHYSVADPLSPGPCLKAGGSCGSESVALMSWITHKRISLSLFSNVFLPAPLPQTGSDSWTAAERRQFNKAITAYKKDFFMVQKQVTTKTVAQCVEFYYTYKKHVKMGRNGTLTYGVTEPSESRTALEELDLKGSHRLEPQQEEDSRKWEGSADRKQDVCPSRVAHALQSTENPGTVLIMKGREDGGREQPLSRAIHPPHPPPPASKPRHDGNARKTSPATGNKGSAGQEGEFPCKKCGRIFYKVKSRSAHMKSHAEQEKKAAALRQKEAEERAAAEAAAILAARQQNGTRQVGGDSTNEDSSDGQDEEDEDWQARSNQKPCRSSRRCPALPPRRALPQHFESRIALS